MKSDKQQRPDRLILLGNGHSCTQPEIGARERDTHALECGGDSHPLHRHKNHIHKCKIDSQGNVYGDELFMGVPWLAISSALWHFKEVPGQTQVSGFGIN